MQFCNMAAVDLLSLIKKHHSSAQISAQISAQAIVNQHLERIAQREHEVQAWEYFDPAIVQAQAERIDRLIAQGLDPGALSGIPIAIKDIFATQEMPTGWGTPIHAGRQRGYDAAVVERLRAAGAVIMGKTVTTEYATARAGKTRNPHHLNHTPGGSSSGSAAAVAAGMVPVAIGSQTVGSILRPAAYCGVVGFKPSFGSISRYGAMPVSRELDHVGIFARTVRDIQLICAELVSLDRRDPDCVGIWQPKSDAVLFSQGGRRSVQKIALIQTPFWHEIDAEAQERLQQSAQAIQAEGIEVIPIDLPDEFSDCLQPVQVLMSAGLAAYHGQDYDQQPEQLSPKLRQLIEQGRCFTAIDYAKARQLTAHYCITLAKILSDQDAILTPVTTGTAPSGLEDTGSPMLCALWTLCGLPAISIPAGKAENGLPLAVQLVGRRMGDADLLEFAAGVRLVLHDRFNPG